MTTQQQMYDRLDAPMAEAWMPEEGDKLIGIVTDIDTRSSEYGDDYTILTIETEDGEAWAFHAFRTVARNEVAKANPQVGDKVGVKYLGVSTKEPPKGQSAPHLYRVIVFERGAFGQAAEAGKLAALSQASPSAVAAAEAAAMEAAAQERADASRAEASRKAAQAHGIEVAEPESF